MIFKLHQKKDVKFVVNGFWRSGTTWLFDIISDSYSLRSRFEPFNSRVEEYMNMLEHYQGNESLRLVELPAWMPFVLGKNAYNDGWVKNFIDQAIKGELKSKWISDGRSSTIRGRGKGVCLKFVRGYGVLDYLVQDLGFIGLHVRRDPAFSISSMMRNNWGGQWLDAISWDALIYSVDDGRAEVLSKKQSVDVLFDQKDPVDRVLAYWSILEEYAEQIIEKNEAKIQLVSYERMIQEGPGYLHSQLLRLDGLPKVSIERIGSYWARKSKTTCSLKTRDQSHEDDLTKVQERVHGMMSRRDYQNIFPRVYRSFQELEKSHVR